VITVDFKRLDPGGSAGLAGARILDVGCGSGRHAAEAYRLPYAVVIGVDVNIEDLGKADKRLALHDTMGEHGNGSWHLAGASADRLPFMSDSFDLVICSEVLEHLIGQDIAMGELLRVLKAGGNLVLSVPRYLPEKICWCLSREYCRTEGGHVRIYRKKDLLSMLRRAGAVPWGIHYAHSLHTPYWWLKCLVGPGREDHPLVNLYHRLLVWDMMARPGLTRRLEYLLNPLMGKSLVVYAKKF
jgi:ubiquinone/menaquinone biosynthesis C-methylase UbiE